MDVNDDVEVAFMPVLLECSMALVAGEARRYRLTLTRSDVRPIGIVSVRYGVQHPAALTSR